MAGVIGHPVRHSLSPVLYNAAFAALDLDWAYVAFDVAAGQGGQAVEAMRVLGLEGLSVTMPHKESVAAAVDSLSGPAAQLGAVNCVARLGTTLVGHNTDGAGFIDALVKDEGLDPAGLRCLVLGGGGAARAVVLALSGAGAADVAVWGRTPARASEAAALAGSVGRVVASAESEEGWDLIVNATPVGMAESPGLPLDPGVLAPGVVVADLIYHPPSTALLDAARAAGAVAVNGVGMLIHQAAHQFRLWTGEDPPLEVMSAAAVSAIAHRGS